MPELCCAVALAQTERMEVLVQRRCDVAKSFNDAVLEFDGKLISTQKNYPKSTNTYWTWVAKLNTDIIDWDEFRTKYLSLGGDPFYGAWKLSYLEPMFETKSFLGRERFISESRLAEYKIGLCPTAEAIQPKLMQFKTNYWKLDDAKRSVDALVGALNAFC